VGAAAAASSAEPGARSRPEPTSPPTAAPSTRDAVRRALVDEYVRRTGYPEEMLDPGLDLEAELGIDTVKQVAALAAVRARFGLPPDPAFKLRDASTIAKAVDWFVRRLSAVTGGDRTSSPQPPVPPAAPLVPAPPAAAATPTAVDGTARGGALDDVRARVHRAIVEELVKRTGYPEEMLDPELDLEAELGIDTVKQVAVLAVARERFGLPPDPGFKLRDANTIRKAVEVLARRLAAPPPPHDPSGGPRPPAGGASLPRAGEGASSGTLAPAPAPERGVAGSSTIQRLLAAMLSTANGAEIRELASLELRCEPGDGAPGREALVDVAPAGPDGVRLRAVLGQDVAEGVLHTGERPPVPGATPEILRAIAPDRRERAASGAELREVLAPVLRTAEGVLAWARSDGFMVAAGGAQVPSGDGAHRLAAALACAGELATFAWVGLTGAPHVVCSVERVRVHLVPAEGEEIGVHARMVSPEGGLWRADVTVVRGEQLVAELRGLCGRPLPSTSAEGPVGEAAQRAWSRFCRRMQGGGAREGVA